jgi:hypothetical protein
MSNDDKDLPPPLVPPDCDLRGIPYMAVNLIQIFESDLYALSSGDEFKAAFTLWGKSFSQIPAGSLPANDRLLEHLSGAKRWSSVRDMALRGWFKCHDGRLYHKTVAEAVLRAWSSRLTQRQRTEAARAALAANRNASRETAPVTEQVALSVTDNATDSLTASMLSKVKVYSLSSTESAAPSAPPAPRSKIGRRIADDWCPSLDDRQFASNLGLDPDSVAAKFRDYWRSLSGSKATKVDWSGVWRNWCRSESERRPAARASPTKPAFRNGFAEMLHNDIGSAAPPPDQNQITDSLEFDHE